jgi:hypothetical protein
VVIAIDHYINGRTLSGSIQRFPEMMKRTFQPRSSLNISYLADGLYSAETLNSVLKEALNADKHILDVSYATATGTRVGLLVATLSRHPSYRVLCILSKVRQLTACYIIILFRALDLSSKGRHASVLIPSLPARSAGRGEPAHLA